MARSAVIDGAAEIIERSEVMLHLRNSVSAPSASSALSDSTATSCATSSGRAKRVSWPASARQMARGEPWLVKTFESFDHPSLLVVLDCGLPAGAEFECMLSIAAACLRHASAQGWPAVVCSAPAAGGPGLWALALPPHSLQWQDDLAVLAGLQPLPAAPAYGHVLRQALVEHARSNTVLSFAREALVLPVERGA